MHQGAKSKSGWYYRKRRREKLGMPILTRGGQPGRRKPEVIRLPKVPRIKLEMPPRIKKIPVLKRPKGRPSDKKDLIYVAKLHGWVDEDSINNKR